jgi:HD superfamily phosphohydrolase
VSEFVANTPNQFYEIDVREIPRYEVYDDRIVVQDPVWGSEVIGDKPGDAVFLELVNNDLVLRSKGIEQLTLDPSSATIPGTSRLSRWEHMWGSTVFVRKMTEHMDISEHERTLLQLRTFVSDLGHTAFSHLGDWMFQGAGGNEDQHDLELGKLLEISGVNDTLRRHGFRPEEVIFPDIKDWIECKAPDLNVDRVDYAAREMKRWLDVDMDMHYMLQPESFQVSDSKLVLSDIERAKRFGKGYLLLASEHWSEPVHRVQLFLLEQMVRRVLTNDSGALHVSFMDTPNEFYPRDYLYAVDSDVLAAMQTRDEFMQIVSPLISNIGLVKRQLFAYERQDHLRYFLSQDTNEYPNPLEHYDYFASRYNKFPLLPSNLSIIPVDSKSEIEDFGTNPYTVDFFLTPLKPRTVDPLFKASDGTIQRLSEVDDNFKQLQQQHYALLMQPYVARLHVNNETKDLIEAGLRSNEKLWEEALIRPRMKPERLREVLHDSAMYTAMSCMIDLQWYR